MPMTGAVRGSKFGSFESGVSAGRESEGMGSKEKTATSTGPAAVLA
jgi:hypothetical protein